MNATNFEWIDALAERIPAQDQTTQPETLERLSKDFYWYSPVLKKQLKDMRAQVAVTPNSIEEVIEVLRFVYEWDVPITVRGGGTGNYGQCIPLYGGVLLDMSKLDRILAITPEGTAITEPGARLVTIEKAARLQGWELRCYPSTFVKASVGGFICGGSGGVGSIEHGLLQENDNVRGVEILTVEQEPRRFWLRGPDALEVLHAWGTNGVVIGVELALAPKKRWGQMLAVFPHFLACYDFAEKFALTSPWPKRLLTCMEWPLPAYFTPLKKYLPEGKAALLMEFEESGLAETRDAVMAAGGEVTFEQDYASRRSPLLSDFTFNHTTLWAIKADPSWTYLQCGFDSARVHEQYAGLKARLGDDCVIHIEILKARDGRGLLVGSIPVVRFTSEERLLEVKAIFRELGLRIDDPHCCILARPNTAEHLARAKHAYDPKGLMNPGKIRNYPLPAGLQELVF
jgi:FAD/FMN-containing dehydrogenase